MRVITNVLLNVSFFNFYEWRGVIMNRKPNSKNASACYYCASSLVGKERHTDGPNFNTKYTEDPISKRETVRITNTDCGYTPMLAYLIRGVLGGIYYYMKVSACYSNAKPSSNLSVSIKRVTREWRTNTL